MKKILFTSTIFALVAIFSSCGMNGSLIVNQNQNSTQVQLGSNNFKVVDKVVGSAQVSYIFRLGGLKQKQLYADAYSAMLTKANLLNSSRAIINVVTEEHVGGVPPFVFTRTVTVSANVIEFTK